MTFPGWLFRGALAVLLCAGLAGCLPGPNQSEEEKEPHFLAGKSAINSMDYKGAIEAFEKALEVNPHSSAAHFELAWLYDQKDPNPAAAIYHYEQYLRLQPGAGNAETVTNRILACKQELAKAILLPNTPGMQRELDQLAEENKRLRDEVEKWRAYYRTQPGTNPVTATATPRPVTTPDDSPVATASPPSNPTRDDRRATRPSGDQRTHTVQAGETPYAIARKYGIKLDALQSANPGMDPRRLRVGQTLNIPSP